MGWMGGRGDRIGLGQELELIACKEKFERSLVPRYSSRVGD